MERKKQNKTKQTINKQTKHETINQNYICCSCSFSSYFHSSCFLSLLTIHFFFSLACASSYIPSFFRCSGSTDAISLSEQCESHIAFPGITFTYLFGAHTYPSHPFSSVFLSNVFSPLRIHFPLFDLLLFFSLTYFCFSHIVTFRNRYTQRSMSTNNRREYSYFSLSMFMCPQRPLYVARGKILHYVYDDYIINCFPFFSLIYLYVSYVYFNLPPSIICIFRLPFSDHAVVIFPQPDRIHVRF